MTSGTGGRHSTAELTGLVEENLLRKEENPYIPLKNVIFISNPEVFVFVKMD